MSPELQIADNIRRDIAAAGVPWSQFQHVLLAVTRIKCLSDGVPFRERYPTLDEKKVYGP